MILLRAARERLGPDAVAMGHALVDFEQQPDGRVTGRRSRTAATGDRGVTETADLLIGADGIHSAVRRKLYPDEGPVVWNGLSPSAAPPNRRSTSPAQHDHGRQSED